MTETIEQKALALVRECESDYEALCRAIKRHEQFAQEVSDAIQKRWMWDMDQNIPPDLQRFILPKPVDPLVDAVQDWWDADGYNDVANLRAAIEKRGGKIVWGEG